MSAFDPLRTLGRRRARLLIRRGLERSRSALPTPAVPAAVSTIDHIPHADREVALCVLRAEHEKRQRLGASGSANIVCQPFLIDDNPVPAYLLTTKRHRVAYEIDGLSCLRRSPTRENGDARSLSLGATTPRNGEQRRRNVDKQSHCNDCALDLLGAQCPLSTLSGAAAFRGTAVFLPKRGFREHSCGAMVRRALEGSSGELAG